MERRGLSNQTRLLVRSKLVPDRTNDLLTEENYLQACSMQWHSFRGISSPIFRVKGLEGHTFVAVKPLKKKDLVTAFCQT